MCKIFTDTSTFWNLLFKLSKRFINFLVGLLRKITNWMLMHPLLKPKRRFQWKFATCLRFQNAYLRCAISSYFLSVPADHPVSTKYILIQNEPDNFLKSCTWRMNFSCGLSTILMENLGLIPFCFCFSSSNISL